MKGLLWLVSVMALITVGSGSASQYENNFYIILSSSKFYFNYRHSGDTMGLYVYLKSKGIQDDHILLMLPENHACNARNKYPGVVYFQLENNKNFYCDDVEVDYKSDDLTFESILNLFRGRYDPDVSLINPHDACYSFQRARSSRQMRTRRFSSTSTGMAARTSSRYKTQKCCSLRTWPRCMTRCTSSGGTRRCS